MPVSELWHCDAKLNLLFRKKGVRKNFKRGKKTTGLKIKQFVVVAVGKIK